MTKLIVSGVKPFSVFGLVHMCRRKRIREAWLKDYPKLTAEGGAPGDENAGLVAFLREHFTDLDALKEDQQEEDYIVLPELPAEGRGAYNPIVVKDVGAWGSTYQDPYDYRGRGGSV